MAASLMLWAGAMPAFIGLKQTIMADPGAIHHTRAKRVSHAISALATGADLGTCLAD